MDLKKLVLLVAFAILIWGIVTYQVRSARGQTARPGVVSSSPVAVPPAAPVSSTSPVVPVEPLGQITQPVTQWEAAEVPKKGWGRNPFLTFEEIAKLRDAGKPVEAPPVEAPRTVLPAYAVSAIVIDNRGVSRAVIGSRILRVGDRIGTETVKEITPEAIVLETEGKTRKIQLPSGAAPEHAVPRG
jgi:hypothetical protein